jgi:predicted DsbA family dithiol-disulfide isomerase
VRSTPTIILPDGRKVSGFRNAEALIQMIDEAARYLQRQGIEQAPQEAP